MTKSLERDLWPIQQDGATTADRSECGDYLQETADRFSALCFLGGP